MALAPSGPSEKRAEPDVSLLLRRTGFGTTGAEVEAATRRGYEATVEALLHPGPDPGATATPPPDLSGEPARPPAPDDKDARRAYAQQLRSRSAALTLWWLDRMVRGRAAAGREADVLLARALGDLGPEGAQPGADAAARTQTLRSLGRGDFRELARAMVRDPALIVWLDGQKNTAGPPNENLARELMELFTLGVGHYTETDVREAARALTGWRVDRGRGDRGARCPKRHDDGSKTMLGATGDFDADAGSTVLARPAGAGARSSRAGSGSGSARRRRRPRHAASGWSRRTGRAGTSTALLRALFTDPAFPADAPALVEAAGGVAWSARCGALTSGLRDGRPGRKLLGSGCNALGQVPFRPPSVGGWPAGPPG